ncbi:UNVERIFIED_CONTAM: Major strawberry allergen Fra a 1-B [Sesamum radiatum]|uniref:Major strawberry allergen Fra a 1-B n=1 Tax=Sesamum radiatum TaxID=300843 RepID=A0AAW2V1P2_SESRA
MGAITYDIEIPSSIPAAKMFKAVVLDADTLIPKYKSAKHRVDALDTENLTHSYTIVEGDALAGVLESITYHVKIVPTEDGGCICKNRSIYHTKGDVEINEEKIKEGKEKAMQMFKAIEAYLQANA